MTQVDPFSVLKDHAYMKTASVSLLRQNFARVLAWVEAGEEVVITKHRQPVAQLVPWSATPTAKRPMPDIEARLKKVFGTKVIPDRTMQSIWDVDRGNI